MRGHCFELGSWASADQTKSDGVTHAPWHAVMLADVSLFFLYQDIHNSSWKGPSLPEPACLEISITLKESSLNDQPTFCPHFFFL